MTCRWFAFENFRSRLHIQTIGGKSIARSKILQPLNLASTPKPGEGSATLFLHVQATKKFKDDDLQMICASPGFFMDAAQTRRISNISSSTIFL